MGDYFASWELFRWSYLGAIIASSVLGLLSVYLVGRRQVFLTAAVGQMGLLGVALATLWGWGSGLSLAVAISIAAALLAHFRRKGDDDARAESEVWLYLVGAAGAAAVLTGSPQGLKSIQSALVSNLASAKASDALVSLGALIAAVVWLIPNRRKMALFLTDPAMAAAVGMNVTRLGTVMAAVVGLALGLSIPAYGFLFVFSSLTAPALAARNVSPTVGSVFWLAPIFAASGAAIATFWSFTADLALGQVVVLSQALILAFSWIWREIRAWYVGE